MDYARGSVSYGMQSAQLKEIRRADPDGQGRHSFTAQQQTLRRLDTTFKAFFERSKPQWQEAGLSAVQAVQAVQPGRFVNGDGAVEPPSPAVGAGAFPGCWIRQGPPAPGDPRAGEGTPAEARASPLVRHRNRRYRPVPLPPAGHVVGVDVGVARFLTTSDGEVVGNPGFSPHPLTSSRTCSAVRHGPGRVGEPRPAAPGTGPAVAEGPQPQARFPSQDRPRARQ